MFRTVSNASFAIFLATSLLASPIPAAAESSIANEATAQGKAELYALLSASDAADLERSPLTAFARGDFTNADRIDDFSPAAFEAECEAAKSDLAALQAIDRAGLEESEKIAYDKFAYALERRIARHEPEVLRTVLALPLYHHNGFHVFYPRLSVPGLIMPFASVNDYANNLSRHRAAAAAFDESIARFRSGAAQGITLPRLSVAIMIDQLEFQLAATPEQSPYYAPVRDFPETIPEADRDRLIAEHDQVMSEILMPAIRRLRDFLAEQYLPLARESIAATEGPGGEAYYAYRLQEMTTLPLAPEEIHRTGLAEVTRINAALAQAREEAGDRTIRVYTSKAELQAAWYEVARKVDPRLDALFVERPKTPLQILPYEEYREKQQLAAQYFPGNPDGSRPGTFYFSGYNLPERRLGTSTALYMHEGNPGHHFQIMLAFENAELPDFMRYRSFTVFSEGWGLYAESLGYELGLYDDPIERIEALEGGELLRAVRLVVDTGMHAMGWSRERAVEYMVANGQPRDFAESETARYIVNPGQATAYKIGELKIKELRARAEAALGGKFAIPRFHQQVLGSGGLPLPVLEAKIDRWIAKGGG